MRKRVFITGIGMVVPHGDDGRKVFEALCEGRSAVRKTRTGTEELGNDTLLARSSLTTEGIISKAQLLGMDRVSQLAVVAAHNALRDAGLPPTEPGGVPTHAGVYVGCGLGGSQAIQDTYQIYWERHSRRLKPSTVPLVMANAPAAHISMQLGLRGPTLTFSVACASSAIALGEAARAIRHGYIDCVLAGGAESMMNDCTVAAWERLGALAKEHPDGPEASCRPFALDRTGFVLGEGAAMLILESEERVQARGVKPIAEIVGFGCSSDAHNLTQPLPEGQTTAMTRALQDAQIDARAVRYINAHATATPAGDKAEVAAVKQTFGEHARSIAVSSTKSMHGHLVGAAGALELAITAYAVQQGRIPPTINLTSPDPECDLDFVPEGARTAPYLEYALSNSFGFGGSNAAVIVRRA